jgi:hypothetical protein
MIKTVLPTMLDCVAGGAAAGQRASAARRKLENLRRLHAGDGLRIDTLVLLPRRGFCGRRCAGIRATSHPRGGASWPSGVALTLLGFRWRIKNCHPTGWTRTRMHADTSKSHLASALGVFFFEWRLSNPLTLLLLHGDEKVANRDN